MTRSTIALKLAISSLRVASAETETATVRPEKGRPMSGRRGGRRRIFRRTNTYLTRVRMEESKGDASSSATKQRDSSSRRPRHRQHGERRKSEPSKARSEKDRRKPHHRHHPTSSQQGAGSSPQEGEEKHKKPADLGGEGEKLLGYTPEELGEIMAKYHGAPGHKIHLDHDVLPVDLEFSTGLPPPSTLGPVLMKIPSQLGEACKVRYTSMDDPLNYRFHLEPLMGLKVDPVQDVDLRECGVRKLEPADRELMDMARDILGDEEVDTILAHGIDAPRVLEERKKQAKRPAPEAKMRESAAQQGANWLKNTTYLSNNLHESVHGSKTDARRPARDESLPQTYEEAARTFDEAAQPLVHATDPSLTVEWSLPVFPDARLWANSYVRVDVDNDPPAPATGAGPLLASQIFTTDKKSRGQKSLSTSVSAPTPDGDYAWVRQYHLSIRDDGHATDRLVLFLGSEEATYVPEAPKRVELDHCRLPRAALNERKAADRKNGYSWTGKTKVAFDDRSAFEPGERNQLRAKLREVNTDVSDDEDLPLPDVSLQDEAGDDQQAKRLDGEPDDDDEADASVRADEDDVRPAAVQPLPPPLIEAEDDDDL